MKPYYEHAGITIYHGDCREVLPTLDSVDLVWTDPPYPEEFLPLYSELSKEAARLLPDGGHCFAYCGHMFLPEVMHRMATSLSYWWILCVEHRESKGTIWSRAVVASWKPILWYRKPPTSIPTKQIPDRLCSQRDKYYHEWGQGREGGRIITAHCPEDGLVVDPFMGGGTTLLVARANQRRAIGIEIEERYCEIAAKRLTQEVFSFSPFEQEGSYADSGR